METKSYRTILSEVLEERQKFNPSYSLRSFAKSLDLDSSSLSRVLNGKQGLSKQKARKIALKLGFKEQETREFCLLVQLSDSRSKKDRDDAKEKILQTFNCESLAQKELDDYEILKDWYNIAILELVELDTFIDDPHWIALELGVSPLLVKKSIQKLLNLGLITFKEGRIVRSQKILRIDKNLPSKIMKGFYDQLLDKAKKSIYLQNTDERFLSSVTLTLDKDDIQFLDDEIKKFRSHFNQLAESLAQQKGKKKEFIYCLSTQFFKLNEGAHS